MKENDDNKWSDYTADYLYQIIQVYRDHANEFFIQPNGVEYLPEGIVFKDNLHGNAKELYTVAYNLKPESVLECGCGGCYHLKNLSIILPATYINGFDITLYQLNFGKWFSQLLKEIEDRLFVMDFTKRTTTQQYEFVFTQAVIMHLSSDNGIKAMQNMKKMSSKYIFMIENPNHHGGIENWTKMVNEVFGDCDITRPSQYISHAILITKR